MTESELLHGYLVVGALLFGIGLAGFLVRRNLIVMFLCAEMMLQGISLSLIAFSRFYNDWDGQMLVIFIITVAACEAGVGLVLILMLCRQAGNLDVASWQTSREADIPPFVDAEVPEERDLTQQRWPVLTPAGVEPETDPEEQMHRSHV